MHAESTDVKVRLPAFEGPLDLLLHLIRSNEIDIYDIPIVEITRQYDGYLALMKELDLHVAGDYLVMAATLVHIKSRTLLPAPPAGAPIEEDPRAALVRQLVEYEKFKAAAESLRGFEDRRHDVYLRPGDPLAEFAGESLLAVSLFDLLGAFRTVLENARSARAIEIAREELSIAEKVEWLQAALSTGKPLVFQELLGSLQSRAEMVVTFLALLELIRLGRVRAAQRHAAGEIWLLPRSPADGEPGGTAGANGGDDDLGN
ncbi:MAG TPA: segregation/condensation protein A [Verrucomicrobiae bacterium]|nr:segregation/condensation protein A [Verrucomicrobiae bacterium]